MWRDVRGLPSGEIWAVGHCAAGKPKSCSSYVVKRTATGWSSQLNTGGKLLRHLWMRAATDGWAVGEACCGNQDCSCGSVYRFDGTDWSGVSLPQEQSGPWGTTARSCTAATRLQARRPQRRRGAFFTVFDCLARAFFLLAATLSPSTRSAFFRSESRKTAVVRPPGAPPVQ